MRYLCDRPKKQIVSDAVKKQIILNTKDIDDLTYTILLKKQQRSEATKDDKKQILKHSYKKAFGVDRLNEDILKNFDKSNVESFTHLIDDLNIKKSTDLHTVEKLNRVSFVRKLINDLGFNNMFDNTTYINKETLELKMTAILSGMNIKNTNILFDLSDKNKTIENTKQFLGYINTILNKYYLHLKNSQKGIKGTRNLESIYKLIIINEVNELIEYKIQKGFILYDTNNLRKPNTFSTYISLIDTNNIIKNQTNYDDNNFEQDDDLFIDEK